MYNNNSYLNNTKSLGNQWAKKLTNMTYNERLEV